ncbi:aminoglycoside phosphotransferase family protein [Paenibacillus tarimensis]
MRTKDAPQIALVKQVASDCLNTAVNNIERVLDGVSTYVYRVQSEDNTLYLRILPEQDMSFAVEASVHSLLRERGVLVPEVIHYERHNPIVGMSVMIVREIPGSSILNCCSKDIYNDILIRAGKQLAVINQVKVDGFGWVKRDREEDGAALQGEKTSMYDYLFELLDNDLEILAENIFNQREVSKIKSILIAGSELMSRHEPCLNHGDFDDSHIFFHSGRFTGIIDFGEIQGTSPLYDLGHFKLHDGQQNNRLGFTSLITGYNELRELSYDDQTEIDLWALWVGVRRLGLVCKRSWGSYQEHLIKTIKAEMDILV